MWLDALKFSNCLKEVEEIRRKAVCRAFRTTSTEAARVISWFLPMELLARMTVSAMCGFIESYLILQHGTPVRSVGCCQAMGALLNT